MIKKDIFNRDIKAQFKASAKDRIHRFTINGYIFWYGLNIWVIGDFTLYNYAMSIKKLYCFTACFDISELHQPS